MIHGVVRERNFNVENEEVVVDEIAKGLHQVIRDNRKIFESGENDGF